MVLTPTLSRRALAALVALTPLRTPADSFGSVAGYAPRIEGIGGGADVLTQKPSVADVAYPPSLLGYWRVDKSFRWKRRGPGAGRVARSGRRRRFQGGRVFYTRFVPSPKLDGALVAERGLEIDSRLAGATVGWLAAAPDALSYVRRTGGSAQIQGEPTELAVVERSSDLSDAGFGFNELVRVSSAAAAGGLFGGAQLVKAARVKRKFRRAYADDGTSRQIEGLEIMTTYRCLDGVCGVEMPTSTTKSTLRLTRPTVAMLKAAGVEEAPSAAASSGEVL